MWSQGKAAMATQAAASVVAGSAETAVAVAMVWGVAAAGLSEVERVAQVARRAKAVVVDTRHRWSGPLGTWPEQQTCIGRTDRPTGRCTNCRTRHRVGFHR